LIVSVEDSTPFVGLGDVLIVAQSGATTSYSGGFEYLTKGFIALVQPSSGQYGTYITITGSGLFGGGSTLKYVQLAGSNATIVSQSNVSVVVTCGFQSSFSSGHVVLVSDTGAIVIQANGWTFTNNVCNISKIDPPIGQYGSIITVSGTGLLSAGINISLALIGRVPVLRIVSASDSSVVLVVANGNANNTANRSADISLIANTGPACVLANAWMYGSSTQINSVSPSSGQYGTRITIYGVHLRMFGSSISTVTVCGVSASVLQDTDTLVVVSAGVGPSSGGSIGDIILSANTGAQYTISASLITSKLGAFLLFSQVLGKLALKFRSVAFNFAVEDP